MNGASGGFVACSRDVRLQAHSRGWIFIMEITTADAATALAALKIVRTEPALRQEANLLAA